MKTVTYYWKAMALKLRDAYHFVKDEVYDLVVSVYAWYIFNKYLKPKNND